MRVICFIFISDKKEPTIIVMYRQHPQSQQVGGFGYNSDSGGNKHKTLSEEHKRKISEWNRGRKWTDEAKRNLSIALTGRKGKPMTEENKKSHSEFMKGKKYRLGKTGQSYSEESRKKMSLAKLGNQNAKGSKRTPEEIQRIIETNHKNKGKKYKHSQEYLEKHKLI